MDDSTLRAKRTRWNLGTEERGSGRALSEEDYKVEVTSWGSSVERFHVRVRVRRMTDRKQLFPYAGSQTPGPFMTAAAARAAGLELASKIIAADLANPE